MSNTVELPVLQVRISTVEDARRAVFSSLDESGLSAAKQRTVANSITARLRRDGLLASSVEQLYKASEVALLVSRSPEHVVKEAKAGRFGAVFFDAGGWLIPASGVQAWLDQRAFASVETLKEIAA
jgi:hypothetical protein